MTGERRRVAFAAVLLALVLVALLQQTLLNLIPLVVAGHWWPVDLALTAVLLVCAQLPRAAAAAVGFTAGLAFAAVPPAVTPIGVTAGVLSCAGYAAAAFAGAGAPRGGSGGPDQPGGPFSGQVVGPFDERTLPHDAGIAVVGPRVLPAASALGLIAGVALLANRVLPSLLGTPVPSASSLLIMAAWQALVAGTIAFVVLWLGTARRVRAAQRQGAQVAAAQRRPGAQGVIR